MSIEEIARSWHRAEISRRRKAAAVEEKKS